MRSSGREDGVVLLLVLTILVLTVSSVYAFARSSLLEVVGSRHRVDQVRATLLARSGIGIGVRAIVDDGSFRTGGIGDAYETRRDPWYALGDAQIEVDDASHLSIIVRDMGGRINLNGLVSADGEQSPAAGNFLGSALERIIREMPGRDEDKPYEAAELAEAILDWIDLDHRTRLGSLERERYGQVPPNRKLLALAELAAIPGMDAALSATLPLYFTVHPLHADVATAGVNPNTAPPHVLGLIYTGIAGSFRGLLDASDVYQILRAREEGQIFCPTSAREGCVTLEEETGRGGSSFPPLTFRNSLFSIRSTATVQDAEVCVEAIVDRTVKSRVTAISYQLGCST